MWALLASGPAGDGGNNDQGQQLSLWGFSAASWNPGYQWAASAVCSPCILYALHCTASSQSNCKISPAICLDTTLLLACRWCCWCHFHIQPA
jgi:hypothetical protein